MLGKLTEYVRDRPSQVFPNSSNINLYVQQDENIPVVIQVYVSDYGPVYQTQL